MPEQQLQQMPPEIQSRLDAACDLAIAGAEKDYHNPLQPFDQYAEKIRLDLQRTFADFFTKQQHAGAVLKEYLLKEEQENPNILEEARWVTWEKIAGEICKQAVAGTLSFNPEDETKRQQLQEQFGVSWSFMDRVYAVADKLIDEAKYAEAASVCDLLLFLHFDVPEYWTNKGIALFGIHEYETALYQYMFSLRFNAEDPSIYFQMARCYFQLKEIDHCKACLDLCLQYCQQDEKYADLLAEATNIKQAIETKQLTIEGGVK